MADDAGGPGSSGGTGVPVGSGGSGDRRGEVADDAATAWRDRLGAVVAGARSFARVHVVAETDSTQDEALRVLSELGEPAEGRRGGLVVVALRQRSGRGRLGRRWADTAGEGLALTAVIPAGDPGRLALVGAVAALVACTGALRARGADAAPRGSCDASPPRDGDAWTREHVNGRPARAIGIKWPNDVVASGRKLAGVLVEQDARVARLGVGINVAQRSWPPELAATATSLAELALGAQSAARAEFLPPPDRIEVASRLVAALDDALARPVAELVERFVEHDALRGARRAVAWGVERAEGTILSIDPLRAIVVLRDDGSTVAIPAALARIEPAAERSDSG
ncbi:MAG TPA: hypothetical protein PKC43_01785 [Phycisphaerales bacterium]|nr:hypothetical protein [Phycisphaerales bacterium]HMP36156.1 hypothetical protein [Phycisphaerales bacterium]